MTESHPEADPTTAQEPVRVLAAVIRNGDHVLVCRRPAHKRHGGLWEFPGGKLEPGETLAHAARRELREELGIEVTWTGGVLLSLHDPGSPFVIEFTPVEIAGEPAALEHAEVRWVRTEELIGLELAPSDAEFAKRYLPGRI